ncbi:mitochondrial ribosomal protein L31 [Hyphopichia burtonii NRRL Y-1933]|uniref:Large ribosomal subunit protein mL60 n=1 Tax=Hyphopichia burtonii NRRL Y-1933 TaxID=984485 RepID=A0A1E4RQ03_9ASCO|nr:mitochondrial ribosomal protein L31 [Hyphopichia burtonii NRRL Y-1933]ODV69347.1 mitochondrial ribosomal protein L31 [Hyphopichia burtonii NRRL Y-1933]
MFGAFKATLIKSGGYLWKFAPRMSGVQKYRLRQRMKQVDSNIEVLYKSLKPEGTALTGHKKIDYLKFEFPKESQMTPHDKYTTFDKKVKGYRKSLHRVPKWTKKSFRENPKYF